MEKKLKNSCFFRLQFFCLFPILWFPFPIGFYLVAGMDNFFSFFDDHSMNQQQILDGCLYDWLVRFLQFCFFYSCWTFYIRFWLYYYNVCMCVCVCTKNFQKVTSGCCFVPEETHTHTHIRTPFWYICLICFELLLLLLLSGFFLVFWANENLNAKFNIYKFRNHWTIFFLLSVAFPSWI